MRSCGSSRQDLGRWQEELTTIWRHEANRDTSSSTPRSGNLRSTPLGKLDPVIRLPEGIFLAGLREVAQESRVSHRLPWPLSLVDEYTRECLGLHADGSITGADVRRIVARVIGRRGAPSRIRSDNGTEFICEALINWLPGWGAQSIPVAAGSPWENGYIESFHSRLRDEFLERVEFADVADARAEASWYRREYNAVRLSQLPWLRDAKEFSA